MEPLPGIHNNVNSVQHCMTDLPKSVILKQRDGVRKIIHIDMDDFFAGGTTEIKIHWIDFY